MMTCDAAATLIDRMVRQELTVDETAALEAHVAGCAECRTDRQAALSLRAPTLRLPHDVQPARDLWPGVQRRIVRRSPSFAWLAAAAVLLVALSSAVTMLVTQEGRTSRTLTAAPAAVAVIEASYIAESRDLEQALVSQRGRLSPETVATLERNLAIIDAAIAESRAALASDPGNRDLRILLEAGHEQRIALLEQASRVARDL